MSSWQWQSHGIVVKTGCGSPMGRDSDNPTRAPTHDRHNRGMTMTMKRALPIWGLQKMQWQWQWQSHDNPTYPMTMQIASATMTMTMWRAPWQCHSSAWQWHWQYEERCDNVNNDSGRKWQWQWQSWLEPSWGSKLQRQWQCQPHCHGYSICVTMTIPADSSLPAIPFPFVRDNDNPGWLQASLS